MPVKPYSKITQRPGKGAVAKLLGVLELAIMRVVWSRNTVTVRAVLAALTKKRSLAYTTVMTVMSRLAEKGLLTVEKQGKTYLYRAARTREEFEALAAGQVAQSLIADFGSEIALSQFVKELSATDPDQLARLAELARQTQEEKDAD
jgi:predicted transcriptional regulator